MFYRDPEKGEAYLCSVARDGIQALLTKIWDLPSQRIDNAIYVTLPKPATRWVFRTVPWVIDMECYKINLSRVEEILASFIELFIMIV